MTLIGRTDYQSAYRKKRVCSTCIFAEEYKNSSDLCWCSIKDKPRKVMEPPCSAYPDQTVEVF